MEAFLGPKWPSEATSKASVIKYANQEGSESFDYPSPKCGEFFRQREGSGRESASHAELTPNGVGGLIYIRNPTYLVKKQHRWSFRLNVHPCSTSR